MSIASLWGDSAPPSVSRGLHDFERELIAAIDKAKAAALPQGLIVALLHAHTQQQTTQLIEAPQ